MTSSRETVLGRVRAALATDNPISPFTRGYDTHGKRKPGSEQAVELLIDRLIDYQALVRRANPDNLTAVVDEALQTVGSIVIPPGLDRVVTDACRSADRRVTVDTDPHMLTPAELDQIDAVVTAARVAIAVSGTIILDGEPDQGRRAITLVPDRHLIILHTNQIVETVPEAITLIKPTRPLTMIAGPSATSDIELQRVEGVHGPRTLEVIIVGD